MRNLRTTLTLAGFLAVLLTPVVGWAHCEIPCGIYHDETRFDMMSEHIETIEKSMNQVTALSAEGDKNYNQLVRWIVNKENHADKYMDEVTQYFLTQRIKPVDASDSTAFADYSEKVRLLHQMLVYAMKCKQTTDLENVEKLKELQASFSELYFAEHGHEH
ncbi:superoxide dismutase [candidate division GN15 bacterium]|nr:superoxide dismutase [candidate division GN15 bacterium]